MPSQRAWPSSSIAKRPPPKPPNLVPLTRHEFYTLAEECRHFSVELARHDQDRVYPKQCKEFNLWLSKVKSYDLLFPALEGLRPARPITRWHLLAAGLLLLFLLLLLIPPRIGRMPGSTLVYGFGFSVLLLYFIPERVYGSTIEMIEAKVLRVVEEMEALLASDRLAFTQAAYFRAKENLEAARRELRQQIHLANHF